MGLFSLSSTQSMTRFFFFFLFLCSYLFFDHVIWPFKGSFEGFFLWLISSWKPDSTQMSSFLPRRLVLPSPWLTSQASLLCLWGRGRLTTICAASMHALWSALWWRHKWLYALLLIDRHNEAIYTFTALLWDVPALLTCRGHPPVLPSPLCIIRTYVIHRILAE